MKNGMICLFCFVLFYVCFAEHLIRGHLREKIFLLVHEMKVQFIIVETSVVHHNGDCTVEFVTARGCKLQLVTSQWTRERKRQKCREIEKGRDTQRVTEREEKETKRGERWQRQTKRIERQKQRDRYRDRQTD